MTATRGDLKEIAKVFLGFGVTAFGGPQAHVGYMHDQFVERRKWLDDAAFTELLGIGQGLPGPTTTQLATSVGTLRGGILGGIVAFFCFSLPGFIAMTAAGLILRALNDKTDFNRVWSVKAIEGGVAAAAVALVAVAGYKLGKKLCSTKLTRIICLSSASVTMMYQSAWLFPVLMVLGALTSLLAARMGKLERPGATQQQQPPPPPSQPQSQATTPTAVVVEGKDDDSNNTTTTEPHHIENGVKALAAADLSADNGAEAELIEQRPGSVPTEAPDDDGTTALVQSSDGNGNPRTTKIVKGGSLGPLTIRMGLGLWALFIAILVMLLAIRESGGAPTALLWLEAFYRTGSVIFGGGQVVIPMLLEELVETGWMTTRDFLNGFAIVQAMPGPMFNISAYLGAIMGGFGGAVVCFIGLFLPGELVVFGALPVWNKYRTTDAVQNGMVGLNAAAIGLVIAAVYLLWAKAITEPLLAVIAVVSVALVLWHDVPAPAIIVGGGLLSLTVKAILRA